MSWERMKLGKAITLKRGYDLPNQARIVGNVPVISSSGVTDYHNEAMRSGPGVVTGRYGTLGQVFYVNEPYWPLNTTLYVSDFKGNDARFVSYFLRTLNLSGQNSAGAVPGLNRNILHELDIRFPPLPVQQRIAAILSAYDDLIDNNRKRIALLEKAARLLYEEWFVRLQFPGHEHTPVVEGVPQGWAKSKVEDIGEIITGKTPDTTRASYYGEDVPFIKTPDMHGNVYVIETESSLSKEGADIQPKKYLPKNAILVACIGAKLGVVSLSPGVSQTNQQINAVITHDETATYFAFFTLRALKPRLEAVGGGATMPNVNKSKFGSLELLLPNKALLQAFEGFCKPVFAQILILQQQTQKLQQARDLLLPRLMSGELAV
ncbi:restriction endonuclease subunit S [Hymenobacter sp. APR13]|uniref:restriction endonuclease subunit S n=1 Tax=Hymenobacter sp. APR13 TaxID=1356852 RepID=UPI0005C6733A|nr:restriction endonuclease subunit S [Hymenobacter sp. APR13]